MQPRSRSCSRFRSVARLAFVLLLVCGSVVGVGADPVAAQSPNPCVGTMEKRPAGGTFVTMQGIKFTGDGFTKTPSLLVTFGPDGSFEFAHNATSRGRFWAYDADPLANGNFLFVTTEPGITVVEELDPETNEHVWVKRFTGDNGDAPGFHPQNVTDAHDVDLINGDELLVADKGDLHNRLLIYNTTTERVTWEWSFHDNTDAFPRSGGGDYDEDWTHVNDVDKVGPGRYMASVRNFDSVIVVDRETKNITLRLGEDDNYRFMNEQHNPQYLESESGTPTILVADSLNDRVVEWAHRDGEWVRTWELVGGGLNEPRDADRLPNGNTLVVDRKGHRTMEVTPGGRVVWEVYTPYQPYDAERIRHGDDNETRGPTTTDLGVTGTVELHNSASFSRSEIEACARAMFEFAPTRLDRLVGAIPGSGDDTDAAETDGGSSSVGGGVGIAVVAALLAALVAVYYHRT